MAGSKPRSESLKERSEGTNRRCVAVSDDYKIDGGDVKVESSESEGVTFKFGAVVRNEKKSVFGVISDITSGVAEGASAFCENVGDIIKSKQTKKEEAKARAAKLENERKREEIEKSEFLSGKEKEKEVVGKAVKGKYSIEAAQAAVEPKEFGEVVRKRAGAEPKKSSDNDKKDKGENALISFISKNKKAVGIFAAALVVIVLACIFYTKANYAFVYEGEINGERIRIESPEQLDKAVDELNAHLTESFGEGVKLYSVDAHLEKKYLKKGDNTSVERLKELISATNTELYDMYVIYAGDEALLGVTEEDIAKEVIDKFKNYYTGGDETVEFSTDREIKFVYEMAPMNLLMSDVDAAVMRLNGGEKQENTYTIEDGDNMWYIANKFDTTTDELLALNNLTEDDVLNIGDKIIVEAFVPVVNVTTTQVVKKTVEIPYTTETVKTDTQYNTWSEITVKGANGEAEVEEKIVKVNGEVSERTELSRIVTKQPVTQIKTVGTKEPPKGVGTGSFITPARGYISSRYGTRSRGYHTGLDIAGSYGSPIVAADDGKVTFVGWSGGYGNLVKIDHQNGYVTYYAHNSSFAVKSGQTVAKGQVIAYMGSTGNSTGNHCHFEIIKNGQTKNPENYI